jgi:hypothetical protein
LRTGNDPRSRPGTKLLPTGQSTEKASVDSKPTRKSSGRHGQPHEKRKPSGRSPPCPGAARNGRNRDPLGGGIRIRPERSRWVFPPPRSGRTGARRGSFPGSAPSRHGEPRPMAGPRSPQGLRRTSRRLIPRPRGASNRTKPKARKPAGPVHRKRRPVRARGEGFPSVGPRLPSEEGRQVLTRFYWVGETRSEIACALGGSGSCRRGEARASPPEARAFDRCPYSVSPSRALAPWGRAPRSGLLGPGRADPLETVS